MPKGKYDRTKSKKPKSGKEKQKVKSTSSLYEPFEVLTCPVCGNTFVKAPQHAYKRRIEVRKDGKHSCSTLFLCRYSCYVKAGGDKH